MSRVALDVWQATNVKPPNFCANIKVDGVSRWGAWGYSDHDATEKAIDAIVRYAFPEHGDELREVLST